MRLWRLSGRLHADSFEGGYGLENGGRWNSRGHPVTYCSTVPSLCVLEKLVHVQDPRLLPDDLVMVEYEAPDAVGMDVIDLADLPPAWRDNEALTQRLGDAWLIAERKPLLKVPSAIVAMEGAFDRNVLINHRHRDVSRMSAAKTESFAFDARLLRT